MEITVPDGFTLGPTGDYALRLSPDGRLLVFPATRDGKLKLWVRRLNSNSTTLLPGTNDGIFPFWSPDSRWVGFFVDGKLKKIDVTEGAGLRLSGSEPHVICEDCRAGAAWGPDGTVLFGYAHGLIERVSADGGKPVPVFSSLDDGEEGQVAPYFLPDGRHFLFTSDTTNGPRVMFASSDGNTRRPLATAYFPTSSAFFVPDSRSRGWLLYVDGERHHVARLFDPVAGVFKGEAVVLRQVDKQIDGTSWSVSNNGVLAFRRSRISQLTWLNRGGKVVGLVADFKMSSHSPRIAPNQKTIAFSSDGGDHSDIGLVDVERSRTLLFGHPFYHPDDCCPVWSPESGRIVYRLTRDRTYSYLVESAVKPLPVPLEPEKFLRIDPTSEKFLKSDPTLTPTAVSRDGRWLVGNQWKGRTNGIALLSLRNGTLIPVPSRDAEDLSGGSISPDARWLAYTYIRQTDVSGLPQEVHVRSVPKDAGGPGAPVDVQVSEAGAYPVWGGDGKELFYVASNGKVMAVPVEAAGNSFHAGAPKPLFQTRLYPPLARREYDVTSDGQRFLINQPLDPPITVIVNWPQLLKK
jgi:Tol biopolymer transport system component